MIFETRRLILRPWTADDASVLYMYAKEPLIGLSAGWAPPHSEHDSLQMIRGPLSSPETYAIVLRETGEPIGNIELRQPGQQPENAELLKTEAETASSDTEMEDDEAEIGYWIGYPHWGNGYAVEAVKKMLSHAFSDLGKNGIWGKYFDENARSGRVQAKTGFVYHHTERIVDAMGDDRIVHYTYIEKSTFPDDEKDS